MCIRGVTCVYNELNQSKNKIMIKNGWNIFCLPEKLKQPAFCGATTDFPAKWGLRNERRNSILMTRHYPDLVGFWLVESNFLRGTANQKHYPDLGSDTSSIRNFCTRFSDVISRGNQWWRREMSAVFSGSFFLIVGRWSSVSVTRKFWCWDRKKDSAHWRQSVISQICFTSKSNICREFSLY